MFLGRDVGVCGNVPSPGVIARGQLLRGRRRWGARVEPGVGANGIHTY